MRALAVACLAVVLAALGPPAAAETRIALVIGNSGYSVQPLANPKGDAELMARTLKGVGFQVTTLVDADREAMRQAIVAFGRKLRGGDAVGLFYFAGHGVQVNGQNFLIPVGADISSETEVPLQAINLTELLTAMRGAATRISIAILDACRNNPYESLTRGGTRGLAPVSAPAGTLIAYASAPGEVAYDGDSGNSPYTSALARSIPAVGLPVEEVFKRTREIVLKATDNRQTPWEHSSLVGQFVFRARTTGPEAPLRPAATEAETELRLREIADWNRIKDANDAALLRQHVATYPGGAYEELAWHKITRLEQPAGGWSWWMTGTPEPPRTREAESLYERALKLDTTAGDAASLAEARRHYQAAAERGLAAAMHNLARMLDHGRGGPRDVALAARWYKAAADAGHAPAMASLGTMIEYGEGGLARDLAGAVRLYRAAAEKGEPNAMASLAYLHQIGRGVERDASLARTLYRAAAEKGVARAKFNLALMLTRSEGGAPDWSEARRLLEAAGAKGHAGALRELAIIHDEGRGGATRDPRKGAEYLLAYERQRRKSPERDAAPGVEFWSLTLRRDVQRRLAEGGFYKGRQHGIFTAETRRAIEAWAAAG